MLIKSRDHHAGVPRDGVDKSTPNPPDFVVHHYATDVTSQQGRESMLQQSVPAADQRRAHRGTPVQDQNICLLRKQSRYRAPTGSELGVLSLLDKDRQAFNFFTVQLKP